MECVKFKPSVVKKTSYNLAFYKLLTGANSVTYIGLVCIFFIAQLTGS